MCNWWNKDAANLESVRIWLWYFRFSTFSLFQHALKETKRKRERERERNRMGKGQRSTQTLPADWSPTATHTPHSILLNFIILFLFWRVYFAWFRLSNVHWYIFISKERRRRRRWRRRRETENDVQVISKPILCMRDRGVSSASPQKIEHKYVFGWRFSDFEKTFSFTNYIVRCGSPFFRCWNFSSPTNLASHRIEVEWFGDAMAGDWSTDYYFY